MNYKEQNSSIIENAFKRAVLNTQASIERGYRQILDIAVEQALNNHDETHTRHLEYGDCYGWLLVHNGQELGRRIWNEGGSPTAKANSLLSELKGKLPGTGWYGVVMASMFQDWFSLDFEQAVLYETIGDLTRIDYSKYFKPIV